MDEMGPHACTCGEGRRFRSYLAGSLNTAQTSGGGSGGSSRGWIKMRERGNFIA